jgi:hypothetical protein
MLRLPLIDDQDEQAVRLPAEFPFDSKEVYVRKNPDTGEVISRRDCLAENCSP